MCRKLCVVVALSLVLGGPAGAQLRGRTHSPPVVVGSSVPRWRVVPSVTLGGGAVNSPVLRLGKLTCGGVWIAGWIGF